MQYVRFPIERLVIEHLDKRTVSLTQAQKRNPIDRWALP